MSANDVCLAHLSEKFSEKVLMGHGIKQSSCRICISSRKLVTVARFRHEDIAFSLCYKCPHYQIYRRLTKTRTRGYLRSFTRTKYLVHFLTSRHGVIFTATMYAQCQWLMRSICRRLPFTIHISWIQSLIPWSATNSCSFPAKRLVTAILPT